MLSTRNLGPFMRPSSIPPNEGPSKNFFFELAQIEKMVDYNLNA